MRIAVDAMGGDYAPLEIVAGAVKWVAEEEERQIFLVGQEELLKQELKSYSYDPSRLIVVNASEVITMEESPATAIRRKKDASIVVASRMVKEKKADAIISCGSTGAQMAAAIFILGRMEGIERPPIVASIPNMTGAYTLLIDVGANVDCKPRQLLQFALLGKTYASIIYGVEQPRVALLNNGEEESKGNTVTMETYALLRQQSGINFTGNVEGRDIFTGKSDVIVCDGFTGNVLLKTMEGMALFIAQGILGAGGPMPAFFQRLDYTQTGGAPLLGINGLSIVCHGSSKREAVYNGLRIAEDCYNKNIIEMQQLELSKISG
ncbi:phosphate acyltransferase PlsX [Syntrophomonas wolfei]|uniref:Phosphate acyltransferase n=1 Tax=Syntrophomonas wolfei subsp. wolfei (strain DSM 2245B / Goettingen) TaxID=335541 RepID=PLSX_SYNWW|nr:phosphate acyltransferase PlsX [Syntrophomonas wolfei]Q0AYW2.1 RecName: Full=Phosphate acyltransferase; AltName: Full=Acyl-ACP phosphotransacylase; AltName: Full=Acyl-[acyl-carrier-protein]--phosphate acyltransferase; AltName: Full=Phosphate-acyl-ACP acyltransferase [Syntrophomonas wolfei subsp. wolfei str. Goettingen G311]ABI68092.1 phosphate:acyl-[acyl carrier protein] acyltransferase [Syntrophomonas wolfei subsp. wolfei str. Goettingen G311]